MHILLRKLDMQFELEPYKASFYSVYLRPKHVLDIHTLTGPAEVTEDIPDYGLNELLEEVMFTLLDEAGKHVLYYYFLLSMWGACVPASRLCLRSANYNHSKISFYQNKMFG